MKKYLYLLLLLLGLVLISGCGEEEEKTPTINPTISLTESDITIFVDETYQVKPVTNITGEDLFGLESDSDTVVSITNDTIKGLKSGSCNIKVYLNDTPNKFVYLSVTVKTNNKPVFSFDGVEQNETIEVDDTFDALEGITVLDTEDGNLTSKISVEGSVDVTKVGETTLTYIVVDSNNNTVQLERKITVIAKDVTAPVVKLKEGASEVLELEYLEVYKADDVEAIDETDGDISDKIKIVTKHNSQKYTEQTVVLEVSDSHGNKTTFERQVKVVWPYTTMVIGHAGSYYGIMNTEEAILNAAKTMHYQAIECDLAQTYDGVFVLCHDADFNKVNIASKTYEALSKVTLTTTRKAGYPSTYGTIPNKTGSYTSTICTLERYLEICKEYGCIAVIELKESRGITNSDQSRMKALMEVIASKEMLNQTIFLTSNVNLLIWVKQNGYDYIPCQYLVSSCEKQAYLDYCTQYKLDISICVTYGDYSNSDEWIQKYKDAGCKVSTYTFSQYCDYSEVQTWIDKGVDFVTCDWHPLIRLKFTHK